MIFNIAVLVTRMETFTTTYIYTKLSVVYKFIMYVSRVSTTYVKLNKDYDLKWDYCRFYAHVRSDCVLKLVQIDKFNSLLDSWSVT